MRPRRSWLLAAAGVIVAAGLGLAVARVSGLGSPGVVALSYRLTDVPTSMSTGQARHLAMRVIGRRLASHRLVNSVDPGSSADRIDIHVKNSTVADVASIVETNGVNMTIWNGGPGAVRPRP